MSSAVFPSLPGLEYPVVRAIEPWGTLIHEAISGKETRVAKKAQPRWRWTVSFSKLASDASAELQTLAGFFNARQGSFDSFLYSDADDNTVTAQGLGTGDGVTATFQLVRAFGAFVETILAPAAVTAVYLNGAAQAGGTYSVGAWGSASPGVITFNAPPGNNLVVTADFSFYWPVRFVDDALELPLFARQLYECKKLSFISIK